MSRFSTFNHPMMLGFDHMERMLDRLSKSGADGYPPYNIEKIGDRRLRITLAVAGFTMDDLSVTEEDNQLVIRGRIRDEVKEEGREFLHRGIAARQFQRTFLLADGLEVIDATLDNGLLHIDLEQPKPQSNMRTISIRKGHAAQAAETGADNVIDNDTGTVEAPRQRRA